MSFYKLYTLLSLLCLLQVSLTCVALWPFCFVFQKVWILQMQRHFWLFCRKTRNIWVEISKLVISFLTEVGVVIRCFHQRHAHLMSNLMKRERSEIHTHTHTYPKIKGKRSFHVFMNMLEGSSSSLNIFQYVPSHPQRHSDGTVCYEMSQSIAQ